MSTQLTVIPPAELVRQSTDIAELCKGIVVATACNIQGKKYVKVEGWQAVAVAHGCVASSRDVKRIEGGVCATGEIRRMADGQLIASAEGFVGEDEPTWFGGSSPTHKEPNRVLPKRSDYAIRAMAQTRAISRACRSAFAHVVVLMDAGLSTTPAEEVPDGGFNSDKNDPVTSPPAQDNLVTVKGKKLTGFEKFSGESEQTKKDGTKWMKPWTRWKLTIEGGSECGTFDEKLATTAEFLKVSGAPCDITVKPGRKEGTFDLVSIEESDDLPV